MVYIGFDMNKRVIKVQDFSKFPGPRYRRLGPASGEQFREEVLLPALKEFGREFVIDLDGVMSYGSSFLEEAFGGAVREGANPENLIAVVNQMICEEEPTLREEVLGYVQDAQKALR